MTVSVAEAVAPEPRVKEPFPTWRIVIWSLGTVGSTIIGSLAGLMTYFYVPPQTAQSDFPQYLSTGTILGITIVGLIGYVGVILGILITPFFSNWSDRSTARMGRRKIFMLISFLPIGLFTVLMFTPPVDHVSSANAVWLLSIVIILSVFRSLYSVSGALIPEFSSNSSILMSSYL